MFDKKCVWKANDHVDWCSGSHWMDGTSVIRCLLLSFLISLLFVASDQMEIGQRKPETRVSDGGGGGDNEDNKNGKWLHDIHRM